jgi:hypothetical protein
MPRHILLKYLREIGWGGVGWTNLSQNRDRWRVLVNTVLNLQIQEFLRNVGTSHMSEINKPLHSNGHLPNITHVVAA